MREPSDLTREEYELTKVALTREDVPAEALALLSAWIEGERLLVDSREGVGGINFCRMDTKVVAPLPHIVASFFGRRPHKRKAGHYPRWNGFYLLLYRDVEEGWKLEQIRKDSPDAQFVPVFAARIKAGEEIKKRLGNDLGDHGSRRTGLVDADGGDRKPHRKRQPGDRRTQKGRTKGCGSR